MAATGLQKWNAFGFLASFVLSLLAVIMMSSKSVMFLFIVVGQGHFALAYLYQWRAGKIGPVYLLLYTVACGALLAGFQFLPEPALWTLVAAGTIFAIHFFVDEMFIYGVPMTREVYALCAAFVLLYGGLLVRYAYGLSAPVLTSVVVVALCMPLVVRRLRERAISTAEMFFLTSVAVLLLMLALKYSISLVSALALIVLFHYSRWYIYYFFKLQEFPDRSRFHQYLFDVAIINIILVTLFFGYRMLGELNGLKYLFDAQYFYAWTMLHVLFSIRLPKKKAPQNA